MAQPSPSHQAELKQALEAMSGLDYVRDEEVAAIPVVQREVKQVIYGPLADFPLDPEVVLFFPDSNRDSSSARPRRESIKVCRWRWAVLPAR